MNLARAFVIFSYGLFAIAAQSLLFREFITTFEGNDISVGIFFGSWFMWVGIGAALVSRWQYLAKKLVANIELLFLCYLPAFIVQFILIVQARELVGLESYALWSIRDILLASVLVNAPLSVITGLLFPTACRWIRSTGAISRIYVIEATGSFAGGIGVTLLLWLGTDPARIFLILAALLSASVFAVRLAHLLVQPSAARRTTCILSAMLPVAFSLCLITGADKSLTNYLRIVKWTKLLPQEAFAGAFHTSQAEYLFGVYQGQWVAVREGSVCEALPDNATSGRIAAISLCQNPSAESVLVIGSGLGLCGQFIELPQISSVTWAHPDPEYAWKLDALIPAEMRISDRRFQRLSGDIRRALAEATPRYDIAILNLPDATSSVLNRYYTLEFYEQIKRSLRRGGILAVRVSAGENIMGTELINLGASIMLTLQEAYSGLALAPGEEAWFIVSDSGSLSSDPAVLRGRLASIEGDSTIFSPEALLSVYLPDKASAAIESYSHADLPKYLLINRDSRPLTYLYSLLLTARQSGAPLIHLGKLLVLGGPLVFLAPIMVLVLLRLLYVADTRSGGSESGFDSSLLVFLAGFVAIASVIVLMYLYQTYFGSLYLHIGVVSSLFMVGLTASAAGSQSVISRIDSQQSESPLSSNLLALIVVIIHALVIAAIAFVPARLWGQTGAGAPWMSGHLLFAVAFLVCGLCSGCYFPIAARRLGDCDLSTEQIGGKLETADHMGAAIGGVLTSLVLVPVLGTRMSLLILTGVIVANIPATLLAIFKPHALRSDQSPGLAFHKLGYVLLGVAATAVICSNILARADARLRPSLPQQTAQALAGDSNIERISITPEDTGRQIVYFNVRPLDPNGVEPTGYILSSADLAPKVRGFGGRMNLAIHVDAAGNLLDFHIVRSNETPSYLKLLDGWQGKLKSRCLFEADPFAGVDTVTGATVSSQAVLAALRDSATRFCRNILGESIGTGPTGAPPATARYVPDARAVYLLGASFLAIVLMYFGGFRSRLIFLAVTCVAGGLLLNAQYSMEQIATLLSLHAPALELSGVYLLVIGVPLLVALFGNIYCGYICPFGAAQELLRHIIPPDIRQPLPIDKMQKARFFKYVVLFVLIVVFFVSRDRTTLRSDPLITIFSLQFSISDIRQWALNQQPLSLLILGAILVGSLLYTRFWCRYLCPAGAFLSLLNRIALLRRLVPTRRFGTCEFGLTAEDQLDCIYCDRCRYPAAASTAPSRLTPLHEKKLALPARSLVAGAMIVAVLVSAVSIDRFIDVLPAYEDYSVQTPASGGQPRDVDMERLGELIRQNKLSDKEAEFYKKVE